MRPNHFLCLALATASAGAVPRADAATFKVGSDAACTHQTIQAAIDAADANPGGDSIRIARNQQYLAQALEVDGGPGVYVSGGYATCDAAWDGIRTVIDGRGNGGVPVIWIGRTNESGATFDTLDIIGGGTQASPASTIVVNFSSFNIIFGSTVRGGHAQAGGAIRLDAGLFTSPEISIGNTDIVDNEAADGGAIYCRGGRIWLQESRVAGNRAGRGGGVFGEQSCELWIQSGRAPASSTGIRGNVAAANGGGIWLGPDTRLAIGRSQAFGTLPEIVGNRAAGDGGGIYLDGLSGMTALQARITGVRLAANVAGDSISGRGGAMYARGNVDAKFTRTPDASLGRYGCDTDCNVFADNIAVIGPIGVGPASGGAIHVDAGASVVVDSARFAANVAEGPGGVVRAIGAGTSVALVSSVLSANAGDTTLAIEDGATVQVVGSTSYQNDATALAGLLRFASLTISGTIAWGPGWVERDSGSTLTTNCVMAASTFGQAGVIAIASPGFVDPAAGNFRLQLDSPAVDACSAAALAGPPAASPRDAEGKARGFDRPARPDLGGPYDAGAYEDAPDALAKDGFE